VGAKISFDSSGYVSRCKLYMIEVYKLLTGKEQVDHKQFFTSADMPYDLRGHKKKLAKGRS